MSGTQLDMVTQIAYQCYSSQTVCWLIKLSVICTEMIILFVPWFSTRYCQEFTRTGKLCIITRKDIVYTAYHNVCDCNPRQGWEGEHKLNIYWRIDHYLVLLRYKLIWRVRSSTLDMLLHFRSWICTLSFDSARWLTEYIEWGWLTSLAHEPLL